MYFNKDSLKPQFTPVCSVENREMTSHCAYKLYLFTPTYKHSLDFFISVKLKMMLHIQNSSHTGIWGVLLVINALTPIHGMIDCNKILRDTLKPWQKITSFFVFHRYWLITLRSGFLNCGREHFIWLNLACWKYCTYCGCSWIFI